MTELEKLHIADIYHMWTTGDLSKQVETDSLLTQLYPNDWLPHNSLAIAYTFRAGDPAKGLLEAREALRLNPNELHTYKHVAESLLRLDRFDEARRTVEEGQTRNLDHTYFRRILLLVAVATGDRQALEVQLARMLERDGEREGHGWRARAAAFDGRWRLAQEHYRRVAELGQAATPIGRPPRVPTEAVVRAALFGHCRSVAESAREATDASRINSGTRFFTVPIDVDGSLCGEIADAEQFVAELARRYPQSTIISGMTVPLIHAAIELKRDAPANAVDVLQSMRPIEAAANFWPTYLRGQAFLRLRRSGEAAAEFRRVLDHPGWDPISPLRPLSHLGLARALAMSGDIQAAHRAYDDFFAMWRDADADLPVLLQAKTEVAALARIPTK